MTKEEWLQSYVSNSKISVEEVLTLKAKYSQVPGHCSCDWEGCQGWAWVNPDDLMPWESVA